MTEEEYIKEKLKTLPRHEWVAMMNERRTLQKNGKSKAQIVLALKGMSLPDQAKK